MNGWVIWWAALFILEIVIGTHPVTVTDVFFMAFDAALCAMSWRNPK